MKKFIKIIILLIPVFLFSETFNSYYTMIDQGKYEYIRKKLPQLKQTFTSNPDVLYISGLVEMNGTDAINIFTDFYNKYPNHSKADNAFVKIIEYNYTRGLYNKSIIYSTKFIKQYDKSENIENCINMLINSYHAVGKLDSAAYFYTKYKKLIPHLNLTYSNSQYKPNLKIVEKNKVQNDYISYKNKSPIEIIGNKDLHYTLQFGAFTSPTNANYLKDKFKKNGYNSFIKKIDGKNGKLFAVRVGYFASKNIAERMGQIIKKGEKLNYMVVKIN